MKPIPIYDDRTLFRGRWRGLSIVERLYSQCEVNERTGCWEWTGPIDADGYGWFSVRQVNRVKVHRLSLELNQGQIPEGFHAGHTCHDEDPSCNGGPTCRHRRCINPDHLEAMSSADNTRRGMRPRPQKIKARCKHGHPYTPENTIIRKRGTKECRECKNRSRRIDRGSVVACEVTTQKGEGRHE